MQRTLPPPTASMVGISASTSSPKLSSMRSWSGRKLLGAPPMTERSPASRRGSRARSNCRRTAASARNRPRSAFGRSRSISPVRISRYSGATASVHRTAKRRAEAQQHVGVVDRPARAVVRVEHEGRIIEPVVEVGDDDRIGARAEVGVGAPPRSVEDQASGPFEEMAVALVKAEVDHSPHVEARRRRAAS